MHTKSGTKGAVSNDPSGRLARAARYWIPRVRFIVWLAPLLALILIASYWVRFDGQLDQTLLAQLWVVVPVVTWTKTLAFLAARISLSCHAFVSLPDAFRLIRATIAATACVIAVDSLLVSTFSIPRGVVVIDCCLTTLAVGGVLTFRRVSRERRELAGCGGEQARVLIVGGPHAAETLLRAIRLRATECAYKCIGIVTNMEKMHARAINGIPVVGSVDSVEKLLAKYPCDMLLLSGGDLPGGTIRGIHEIAERFEVQVRVVPDVARIVNGHLDFKPREVAIEDLLGRPTVDLDQSELKDWLTGKRLLVTGSCGSIGSELVRQLIAFKPAEIVLVDRSENGQFHLGRELADEVSSGTAKVILADATDLPRMNSIFRKHRPEIVFHAAAYKHVPLMEENPGEGIKNIVAATKTVADLAHACGVETFVMVSTDKAVNPTSVMGCCKRVAELYVQNMAAKSSCRFVTVRFGNVLGSAGSVIPVFREQIARGGPVTVTHKDMTRFFMTIPEASQLVIQAAAMGKGGEIFVLDMGTPVRIMDLAQDMIRLSGLHVGHDIDVDIVGLRPGEKLYEELYGQGETQQPTVHEKILVARSSHRDPVTLQNDIAELIGLSTSDEASIRTLLKQIVPSYQTDTANELTTDRHPLQRAA